VTFTFAANGSYEVELEQEREGSVTLHAEHVVNVGGGNTGGGGTVTSVDFSWSPASPRVGQPVTFTATSDQELPAGASFKWRMPDDSRPQAKSVTYTFTAPGTYKIRVEVEHGGVDVERERNVVVAP
jgi:PKD repeat protein